MNKIYITKFDLKRLNELVSKQKLHSEYVEALKAELSRAEIVKPADVPSDVVTMNSKVRLKNKDGDSWEYSLVFPEDADISDNKISVLSPVGSALIGYKVADSVTIPTPKGRKQLIVDEIIYQPERSGDFSL